MHCVANEFFFIHNDARNAIIQNHFVNGVSFDEELLEAIEFRQQPVDAIAAPHALHVARFEYLADGADKFGAQNRNDYFWKVRVGKNINESENEIVFSPFRVRTNLSLAMNSLS